MVTLANDQRFPTISRHPKPPKPLLQQGGELYDRVARGSAQSLGVPNGFLTGLPAAKIISHDQCQPWEDINGHYQPWEDYEGFIMLNKHGKMINGLSILINHGMNLIDHRLGRS